MSAWQKSAAINSPMRARTVGDRVTVRLEQRPKLLVGQILVDQRGVLEIRCKNVAFERRSAALPGFALALDVVVVPGDVERLVSRAEPQDVGHFVEHLSLIHI